MSLLKIVPMHKNWLSRLDMIAARMPAANNPPKIGPVCVLTKNGKTALALTI